jgi:hypothetical protein
MKIKAVVGKPALVAVWKILATNYVAFSLNNPSLHLTFTTSPIH